MIEELPHLSAPRLEIVVVPSQEVSNRYEIRLVVHAPSERHEIKIGAQDHYSLPEASSFVAGVYLTLEKRFDYGSYALQVAPSLPEAPNIPPGSIRH